MLTSTATRSSTCLEEHGDEPRATKNARISVLQETAVKPVSHRLGVLPSGNLFLSTSGGGPKSIRYSGLGRFNSLPDAVLISFLSTLDAVLLSTLGATSRAFYAYTTHEPLWKDLVVSRARGSLELWAGNWRKTYLKSFGGCPADVVDWPSKDIMTPGLYSDELFQPALCSHSSLAPFFFPPSHRQRCTIATARAADLTRESFQANYARCSKPVLISNALESWTSFSGNPWTMDTLEQRFGNVEFRAEAFDVPFHVYRQYAKQCDDEDSPLYLFDSRFVEKTGGAMGREYLPFTFFGRDLFELLGPERPDYRWLIVGPARSGSTFHKDPNGTSAWNAVLQGRKGWIMFPPDVCPPGVYTNEDESEVTSPLSIPEWFLTYFDHAWNTYGPTAKDPETRGKLVVGVCGPGEVIYVPSGWWHLVVNLDEATAVTQNFVSEDELVNVLRFMRDKPDQMSGFKGSTDGRTIYDGFLNALRTSEPRIYEGAMQALSKTPPCGVRKETLWNKVVGNTQPDDDSNINGGFAFGFDIDEDEDTAESIE